MAITRGNKFLARFGRPSVMIMSICLATLSLLASGCKTVEFVGRPDNSAEITSDNLPGVPNFSKVCDDLYRGGQPTIDGYEALKQNGIRTIVTLRILDRYSGELQQDGFRTYHLSVKHVHPETEDVLEFLNIVADPDNKPVFVHCREGEDRTGMMVAIYRMVIQDWPREKAIKEMKRMGFNEWNRPIERYLRNINIAELKQAIAKNIKSEPAL